MLIRFEGAGTPSPSALTPPLIFLGMTLWAATALQGEARLAILTVPGIMLLPFLAFAIVHQITPASIEYTEHELIYRPSPWRVTRIAWDDINSVILEMGGARAGAILIKIAHRGGRSTISLTAASSPEKDWTGELVRRLEAHRVILSEPVRDRLLTETWTGTADPLADQRHRRRHPKSTDSQPSGDTKVLRLRSPWPDRITILVLALFLVCAFVINVIFATSDGVKVDLVLGSLIVLAFALAASVAAYRMWKTKQLRRVEASPEGVVGVREDGAVVGFEWSDVWGLHADLTMRLVAHGNDGNLIVLENLNETGIEDVLRIAEAAGVPTLYRDTMTPYYGGSPAARAK